MPVGQWRDAWTPITKESGVVYFVSPSISRKPGILDMDISHGFPQRNCASEKSANDVARRRNRQSAFFTDVVGEGIFIFVKVLLEREVRGAPLCLPPEQTRGMKYFDVRAQQVVSPSLRCGVSRFKPHTVTQALRAHCVPYNSN